MALNEEAVFQKLREIISAKLGAAANKIERETRFIADLDLSGMTAVELVMTVEEWFDFKLDGRESERLVTVGDLAAYVAEHGRTISEQRVPRSPFPWI